MSINWNLPVMTRDGRKVRVLCTDADAVKPIVALVRNYEDTADGVYSYFQDGRFNGNDGRFEKDSDYNALVDVINVPQKRWVNLYWEGDHLKSGGEHYLTKAEAIAQTRTKHSEYSTTIEVTLPASESSHD